MKFEYEVISIKLPFFSRKPEEKIEKFLKEKSNEGWGNSVKLPIRLWEN